MNKEGESDEKGLWKVSLSKEAKSEQVHLSTLPVSDRSFLAVGDVNVEWYTRYSNSDKSYIFSVRDKTSSKVLQSFNGLWSWQFREYGFKDVLSWGSNSSWFNSVYSERVMKKNLERFKGYWVLLSRRKSEEIAAVSITIT